MSQPHVIRLRGPWQFEPVARFVPVDHDTFREQTDGLPEGGKTQVPGDWTDALGAGFRGRVRYTRRFNCPTNLGSAEQVWLVCDAVDQAADFSLNGKLLFTMSGGEPGSCDITPHLQPHNELAVEVSLFPQGHADRAARPPQRAGKGGGIIGEVRLEIRR
jgi:beta-galactosidase/beta-glucuronidase